MMKYTNSAFILLAVCALATSAVEEENLPLRRLRHQTLHIPDLFEMSADKTEKNEWFDAKASSSSQTHGKKRRNKARQQLSEMDVFARLLQSDSSLSLSMPSGPSPMVPTPKGGPTPPAPVVTPKGPTVVAPTPTAPTPTAPTVVAPTPTAPTVVAPSPKAPTAPVPAVTSCPAYPVCTSLGLTGDCCPTVEGILLDCCSGIVPAPMTSPVTPPTMVAPTVVAPAPVAVVAPTVVAPSPVAVVAPTPTSKNKDGSMSSSPTSDGSMSGSGSMSSSPTSDGSMSSSGSMSSDGSMS